MISTDLRIKIKITTKETYLKRGRVEKRRKVSKKRPAGAAEGEETDGRNPDTKHSDYAYKTTASERRRVRRVGDGVEKAEILGCRKKEIEKEKVAEEEKYTERIAEDQIANR